MSRFQKTIEADVPGVGRVTGRVRYDKNASGRIVTPVASDIRYVATGEPVENAHLDAARSELERKAYV